MSGGYKTKQKEAILEYFTAHEGEHLTAANVVDYMREIGSPIAASTVYRCLERLENDGTLHKYIIDESSAACWQYVEEPGQCHDHFHLKCTGCGALLHVDCDYLDTLADHILEHHGFEIDNLKTVFYGLCESCRKKRAEEQK